MIALVYNTLWTITGLSHRSPHLLYDMARHPLTDSEPKMKTLFAIFLSMNSHIPCPFLLIWLPVYVLNLFILSLSIQTQAPIIFHLNYSNTFLTSSLVFNLVSHTSLQPHRICLRCILIIPLLWFKIFSY